MTGAPATLDDVKLPDLNRKAPKHHPNSVSFNDQLAGNNGTTTRIPQFLLFPAISGLKKGRIWAKWIDGGRGLRFWGRGGMGWGERME